MSTEKTVTPLHVMVNKFIVFTNELLDAGWHVYGEQKPVFIANPYHYRYGVVKFFEQDGITKSVCVGLHVDPAEKEDGEAFVHILEYDLSGADPEWDSFKKIQDIDIDDLDYNAHSKMLIDKYKETVIIDFHDGENKFLGFSTGNRAIFLTNENDVITKSISHADHTPLGVFEAASQLKLVKSYARFDQDVYL